jgi:hypothetical protein
VTSNINPSELKLGQEVLHDGLQTLLSDLVNMHRLTPKIKYVMEFQRGLSVKRNLEKVAPLNLKGLDGLAPRYMIFFIQDLDWVLKVCQVCLEWCHF